MFETNTAVEISAEDFSETVNVKTTESNWPTYKQNIQQQSHNQHISFQEIQNTEVYNY